MGSWPKCRTQNGWGGPHSENGSAKISKTSVAEGLFFSNLCTDTFNISFICRKKNKDFNTLWNLCLIIINLMKFDQFYGAIGLPASKIRAKYITGMCFKAW